MPPVPPTLKLMRRFRLVVSSSSVRHRSIWALMSKGMGESLLGVDEVRSKTHPAGLGLGITAEGHSSSTGVDLKHGNPPGSGMVG
jgi:hypothetical protein